MKAQLLDRSRDFDWKWALHAAQERAAIRTGRRLYRKQEFDPRAGLPWNSEALTNDLGLNTVFDAMARGDDFVHEVARKVILDGITADFETVRYRQAVLQDCLKHPGVMRELYALVVQAVEKQKEHEVGILGRYPDWVLRTAVEMITMLLEYLKQLRQIADIYARSFESQGWTSLFAMLKRDLDDEYLGRFQHHLEELRFRNGEFLSAKVGKGNKASNYVLHQAPPRGSAWSEWWADFFERRPHVYSFELHPRDEAGAQALAAIRNRGIILAANVVGPSADHLCDFFHMLRAELAFYVGCINLYEHLVQKGEPTCIPLRAAADEDRLFFRGLYDVGLSLTVGGRVTGNNADADSKGLIIISGPNTGGKSTFLRSVGLAQLMMQSGMFVAAESFSASLCNGLFTHYKREEDVALESGKFDEEPPPFERNRPCCAVFHHSV